MSDSTEASTLEGWSSHFTKLRTASPCTFAVCIQSIHGRRWLASSGPVAPSTSTPERPIHALNIAMDACSSPTMSCTKAAMGLPAARPYPCAMATAISSWLQRMNSGPALPTWLTTESWMPRKVAPGFMEMYSMPRARIASTITSEPYSVGAKPSWRGSVVMGAS